MQIQDGVSTVTVNAPLRASTYTIVADLADDADAFLLVHGYTGAVDKVNRSTVNYVRSVAPHSMPKPLYGSWSDDEQGKASSHPPSDQTLAHLKKRGFLTSKTVAEEEELFVRLVTTHHQNELRVPPQFVIMPTYSCNLRCGYCFQDHMRTNPAYSHLLRTMTPAMADKIVAAMDDIEKLHLASSPDQQQHITFFGGEPLLRNSRPIVEHLMRGIRSRRPAKFSAISNGTDLDAYEGALGDDGISLIQITIDGPPDAHDRRRIYADGSGSFARIAKNVTMCLELGVTIHVRINVDKRNIAGLPEMARVFIDRGWTKHPKFGAYAARIVDHDNGRNEHSMNSWELSDAISQLRLENPSMSAIAPVDDGLKQMMLRTLTSKDGQLPARSSYCGSHSGMYIFDSFGDIYACWERTGDKNLRVGWIESDGKVALNVLNESWRRRTVAANPTCRNCRFALFCGGGCAIAAEGVSGTMFSNYCDAFGKRLRNKIAEAYTEFQRGDGCSEMAASLAAMQQFAT